MDIIACILGSLWHNSCHVYRGRPQPQIAARDPVAASLSRGRQGQEEDPGESDRLAEAVDRRLPGPAEGRKGGRRRAGGGVDPPVVAARARRGGAGNIAGDRLGPRPRTARQSPPRPGHRHGREPADRAGLEAGDGARARSGDRHLQPRRGAGLAGCRRRRALRRLGLAAATAAGHREVPGQEAPRRRRAGALRRRLELPRGPLLPLAKLGYNRDGKKGKLQIVYGLLCAADGCPVALEVFDGDTADPKTLAAQIAKLKDRFGLTRVALVGDRGMITQARLDEEIKPAGLDWITALRAPALRALLDAGAFQLDLFDERDMASITSPDYPGERLMVCRNPELARLRARKREDLLSATERHLDPIREAVRRARNPLRGKTAIALKVGAVLNKHKM